MAKRYKFNEQTLSYETVTIPFWIRVRNLLSLIALGIILSTIVIYIYSFFFETPRATIIRQQNETLQMQYELLIQRFRKTDEELNELMQRDNKVYRPIFEANPIPIELRESGMRGAGRYERLLANRQTAIAVEASLLMDKITKKAYLQSKSFDEIAEYTLVKEQMIDCIPSIQPLNLSDSKIRISALYGYRTDPIYRVMQMHDGIDFAGPMGTPIYATGNGQVVEARFNFHGYGNVVIVDHGFGYKTRYAHLSEIHVKIGDIVTRGQQIALMGSTGKSTGPHLHYEVLHKGSAVNPINFFSEDITEQEYEKIIEALSGRTAGLATDY